MILPVAGSRTVRVPLTVTIPVNAAIGSRQPLTITAVSYTDASVRPAAQTVIAVREGGERLFLPYVSFNGLEPAEIPRLLYLPLVHVGSPVTGAGGGARQAPTEETAGDAPGGDIYLPQVGE